MSDWETYPENYREAEVRAILAAVQAGECVSLVGLSGAGKSNLLGFLAARWATAGHPLLLIDANRLLAHTPAALLRLIRRTLGRPAAVGGGEDAQAEFEALDETIREWLEPDGARPDGLAQPAETVALLLDRFDIFAEPPDPAVYNILRALRDAHKFRLAYVVATRRPLPPSSELAELFHAHTLWLGPLNESDARWNVARYAGRKELAWDDGVADALLAFSRGYPSLLRAACEAHAAGASLNALAAHPTVQARLAEFWSDRPDDEALEKAGLAHHPLLQGGRGPVVDDAELTAKERLLLDYFRAHPDEVCGKDDLIRAVWSEDEIFEEGLRDSSLAQLVRRLRVKIEPDPAAPQFVHTVPSRGYLFKRG
ncbi:MAG: winged helix-turn-helix domain-containing protein [Chloroflexi bacterium]|nr:winged helix-turn-helix domain-containing protein [Chloroflexota bacterium]MCI0645108.1 winged helix-turn-helix domain-containing protein [Chloroflexota bacterium]MCI0731943.1 winged helix-turn-helix domain-containing protein [Chloroflexota bacterium]